MKYRGFNLVAAMLVCAIVALIFAAAAIAGEVFDRSSIATATGTGAGTWTQAVETANIRLVRIEITALPVAIDTVTVTRVTGGTYATTQTVCAIVCASNVGASNILDNVAAGPVYMKRGDLLKFTSHVGTGCVAKVEYLGQQH